MKNGIIETLVEFAQAVEDGANIQTCNTDAFSGWYDFNNNAEDLKISEIQKVVRDKGIRIRIEPATITLYEYSCEGVTHWESVGCPSVVYGEDTYIKTGRSIVSAPINEGDS